MQKKIIVTLLAGLLIFVGFWAFKKYFKSQTVKPENKLAMIAANDSSTLQMFLDHEDVPEALVYAAVIRLGQDGDKTAFEVAKSLINHKSKLLREGAAQALMSFTDAETLPLFEKLVQDPEESVRVFALDSLSEQSSPARIALVHSQLSKQSLTAFEKVALRSALIKMSPTPAEKEKEFQVLIGLSHDKDLLLANQAALKAIQLNASHKAVRELMVQALKPEQKNLSLKSLSIRVLSNLNDETIKSKLPELSRDSAPQVRIAVIQSLHRNCAASRWDILAHALKKDSDSGVFRVALDELAYLERDKAKSLLADVAKDSALDAERLKSIQTVSSEITGKPEVKNCK